MRWAGFDLENECVSRQREALGLCNEDEAGSLRLPGIDAHLKITPYYTNETYL